MFIDTPGKRYNPSLVAVGATALTTLVYFLFLFVYPNKYIAFALFFIGLFIVFKLYRPENFTTALFFALAVIPGAIAGFEIFPLEISMFSFYLMYLLWLLYLFFILYLDNIPFNLLDFKLSVKNLLLTALILYWIVIGFAHNKAEFVIEEIILAMFYLSFFIFKKLKYKIPTGLFVAILYIVSALYIGESFIQPSGSRIISRQIHLLAIGLPLTVYLTLKAKKFEEKLILLILIFLIATALFLSNTRGSIFASAILTVSLLFFYFLDGNRGFFSNLTWKKIVFFVSLLLIVAVGIAYAVNQVIERKVSVEIDKEALENRDIDKISNELSIIWRVLATQAALEKGMDAPLLGNGIGASLSFRVLFFTVPDNNWIDNSYALIFMKFGFAGLLLFFFFLYKLLSIPVKNILRERKLFSREVLIMHIYAYLLIMALISPLLLRYRFSLFWALLIYETYRLKRNEE